MSTRKGSRIETIPYHELAEDKILIIRGVRVILDADLAQVYGVPTKRLNEQVKRNAERFPKDFAFQLTREEMNRSQIATGSQKHRDLRFLPYAFTEHGALMAASVLNSTRAIAMSIYVIRAFVQLREVFVENQVLEQRLSQIERVLLDHDAALVDLYKKIKPLLLQPKRTSAIGFRIKETQ
jgi:hypothetical protein